jgi:hypothetical protein
MLMVKESPPAIRTLRGWAISVLQGAGTIRECEEHGWMHDRAGPHDRERALIFAHQDPPSGIAAEQALFGTCSIQLRHLPRVPAGSKALAAISSRPMFFY